MKILVLNVVGRLSDGRFVCAFPSRWDAATAWKNPPYYPFELAYLSTLLKRELKGSHVQMFDANILDLTYAQTIPHICSLGRWWDVIVTECSALTYPDMTKLLKWLKEHGWTSQAWLTGPFGSNNKEKAYADGWDQVVKGEYEKQVLQSLDYKIERMPSDGLIDLDWLPWPEDEDISRINYREWSNPYQGMVQVFPTRGCPLACSFCVVPSYYGGHGHSFSSHRVRNVENVCDEIEYLATKYEGRFAGCFFNEETHNANIDWFQRFCECILRRGLNVFRFDAMCGYWPFTEDSIKLAARAGYCQIRIGIESTDQEVGKRIGKRIIPEKLWKVLEWCKEAGINVYGTTQMGAPGSTYESDIETLKTLAELNNNGYIRTWQNSVSTPQPGTPMYEQAKREGRLLTEDLSLYDGRTPVMDWPDYPAWKIAEARKEFERMWIQSSPGAVK